MHSALAPDDPPIDDLLESLLLGGARRLMHDVVRFEAPSARRIVWAGVRAPQLPGIHLRATDPGVRAPDLWWFDLALHADPPRPAPGVWVAALEVLEVRSAVLERWLRVGLGAVPGGAALQGLGERLVVTHRSTVRSACGQLVAGVLVGRAGA